MGALRRGLRNVGRNRVRTLLVVGLLSLSVWIFAAMVQSAAATRTQAEQLRRDVATLIQVNPAGVPAGGSAAVGFDEDIAERVERLSGVAVVEPVLRQQFQDNSQPAQIGVINGVRPGDTPRLSSMGGFTGSPSIERGRALTPDDAGDAVAVVGEVFARQYGVELGQDFTLPARLLQARGSGAGVTALRARAVGIFRSGVVFGDNQVFVPLDVLQETLGREGEVLSLWVTAETADAAPAVEAAIKDELGETADVISNQPAAKRAAESLEATARSSRLGAIVAGIAGAAVVALTMALVVRERRTEVGVLKALGSSNSDVVLQFAAEALGLAALGGVIGVGVAAASGDALARALVAEGASPQGLAPTAVTLAWSLGLAGILGVAGSLYPLRQAVRVSPAEAMRPG